MRLHLIRRYKPGETIGRLVLGTKLICIVREAPKECFNGAYSCLSEGLYSLMPIHTEDKGWMISLGTKGLILPKSAELNPGSNELIPFSCFNEAKVPMFSRLAFSKLFERLELEWANDSVVELLISGIPVPYSLAKCRSRSRC
ncbi:MAG: hypothetical protein P8O16_00190 [Algoriphagus sp.]|jgi:hypothetical protein|uniref:hypothetical protein n=1 Tax=Algoriphagus sp. TaxID=1872435 RepID=UPI00262582CD|nr:hypothetical protein [Algoriphagus sp.]MDG1275665.1 hypothetical protein [Algoriphagus sp.]